MITKLITLILAATLSTAVFAQQSLTDQLDAFFKKAEKNGYAGSVLVAKGDQILLSKGYGMQDREAGIKQTDKTVFCIGSITKQFTGAAILKLQDMRKLSVKDPLSKFFPDAPADKKNITIHQCLTHSAGFPDAIGGDYEQVNAEDFARMAFESEMVGPPGEQYEYSNVGYSILGIIIEKVSGEGYEKFLREQLWLPAGMEHTGYLAPGFKPAELAVGYRNGQRWGTATDHLWMADGPGWHLRANGGVLSTVGDMHRWYRALMLNKVMSEDARKQYFMPHISETPDGGGTYYSYGWVVDDDPGFGRFMWHNGGNGVFNAYMGFAPNAKVCVVISSNSNDKIADDYAAIVSKILNGKYQPLTDEEVTVNAGKYKLPDGSVFTTRFNELDNLIVNADAPGLFKAFVMNGDEDPAVMEAQSRKMKSIMEELLAGNYQPFADARKVPEPVVRRNQSALWNDLQKDWGKVQQIEILGSATRPRMNAMLTMLQFRFEKGMRCFTFIWRDGVLEDIRNEPLLEKDYELQGDLHFFAPNNRQTVIFNADKTLTIRQNEKEIKAVKL